MTNKDIISQLIAYQEKHNIKQKVLSTLLGVNKFTMHRWLRRKNKPMPEHERVISKFLKNNC